MRVLVATYIDIISRPRRLWKRRLCPAFVERTQLNNNIPNEDRGQRPSSGMLFPRDYQDDADSLWDKNDDDYDTRKRRGENTQRNRLLI